MGIGRKQENMRLRIKRSNKKQRAKVEENKIKQKVIQKIKRNWYENIGSKLWVIVN